MIFTVQRYIEDYLDKRGIDDRDQYAVLVANIYATKPRNESQELTLKRIRRVRTAIFGNNPHLKRAEFERQLLNRLEARFQKKTDCRTEFPGGVASERRRLSKKRLTIGATLRAFKAATEARAIDVFWQSRRNGTLRRRPEQIGQGLLVLFALGAIRNSGVVLREFASGVGFVDIGLIFGSTLHLVELKILKSSLLGAGQLAAYMQTEQRRRATLVLFDARPTAKRFPIPSKLAVEAGEIAVVVVDINPIPPSRRK